MSTWKLLAVAGLALTLVGASMLSWRDLANGRGIRSPTWDDAGRGFPRREAVIGFPLIVIGSLLQIIGVAVS